MNFAIYGSRFLWYIYSILEKVPPFSTALQEKEGMTMAISKSQQKAVHKYVKANYDRMELTVPKGQRDIIKAHAAALGESTNGFIGRAISEAMERDGVGGPQEAAETPTGDRVSLPSGILKAAQEAAQAAGEALPVFLSRAVSETAERDRLSRDS